MTISQNDGDDTFVKGGTDSTRIGNISDSLKVTSSQTAQKDLVLTSQIFSVSTTLNMASGGSDNALILIKNLTANTKKLFIIDVFAGCSSAASVTVIFKIFSNPTVSANGTTLTISNRYRKTSPAATVMEAYTLPTVSASGVQISSFVNGQGANAVNVITGFQLVIDPNQTLLVTGAPTSNNKEAVITVVWSEE